jgi:tetratricopeptide (TPR) repeat protein
MKKSEGRMRANRRNSVGLVALAMIIVATGNAWAQASVDDKDTTERAKAIALGKQYRWLEALPLFEDLVQKAPDDYVLLECLAQSLINRSVTLKDQDAAGKDLLRAKELLVRAQKLGDHSPLSENLLDLLSALPKNGEYKYADKVDVEAAIKAGEAAFARTDYDEAIKNYKHALELDPKSYAAALFVGDSYFATKRFSQAGEWYDLAAQIDPNRETAYRYHADMLTKQGDLEGARTLSIEAVIADPYNTIPWRGLTAWAKSSHAPLNQVHMDIGSKATPDGENKMSITVDPNQPADVGAVWLAYSGTRVLWYQGRFKKEFPQEPQYRHSLAEETDALTTAAKVAEELAGKSTNGLIAKDVNLQLLMRLYHEQMLEPYILLSAPDQGIAQDYAEYRAKNRAKLEEYLGRFVAPERAKVL